MTMRPDGWPTFKAGEEVPIGLRFHPDVVATLVDITTVAGVNIGDTYVNGVFAPYVPRPLSAAEILARNTATRDSLLATASARIAPLQDAVDLDEATADETAALKLWKQYRVAVNRVDLSIVAPQWPAVPA
ncbi:Caudovirales tail fiber assembly protein [compost metagenome]